MDRTLHLRSMNLQVAAPDPKLLGRRRGMGDGDDVHAELGCGQGHHRIAVACSEGVGQSAAEPHAEDGAKDRPRTAISTASASRAVIRLRI